MLIDFYKKNAGSPQWKINKDVNTHDPIYKKKSADRATKWLRSDDNTRKRRRKSTWCAPTVAKPCPQKIARAMAIIVHRRIGGLEK